MHRNLKTIVFQNSKLINVRYMACCRPNDVLTHTGQKWDSRDYRMVRFINVPKLVNPNWPVKLVAQIPPKEVAGRIAWCDGGSGAEGHPRIFINLDKPGPKYCMYCSASFIKAEKKETPKELCKK